MRIVVGQVIALLVILSGSAMSHAASTVASYSLDMIEAGACIREIRIRTNPSFPNLYAVTRYSAGDSFKVEFITVPSKTQDLEIRAIPNGFVRRYEEAPAWADYGEDWDFFKETLLRPEVHESKWVFSENLKNLDLTIRIRNMRDRSPEEPKFSSCRYRLSKLDSNAGSDAYAGFEGTDTTVVHK